MITHMMGSRKTIIEASDQENRRRLNKNKNKKDNKSITVKKEKKSKSQEGKPRLKTLRVILINYLSVV